MPVVMPVFPTEHRRDIVSPLTILSAAIRSGSRSFSGRGYAQPTAVESAIAETSAGLEVLAKARTQADERYSVDEYHSILGGRWSGTTWLAVMAPTAEALVAICEQWALSNGIHLSIY
jgi:hypothetical protein